MRLSINLINKCMKCIHCNKPLTGYDQKKFCSKSCSATFSNLQKPRRTKGPKWHPCECCGTPTNNKLHCSIECRKKYKTLEEKNKASRAIHNEAYARYMSRRKFQTPADEDIKALQEFYAKCPDGYEVDHIIPISKGGLHSLSNLQYLPRLENRKKSNKILA